MVVGAELEVSPPALVSSQGSPPLGKVLSSTLPVRPVSVPFPAKLDNSHLRRSRFRDEHRVLTYFSLADGEVLW